MIHTPGYCYSDGVIARCSKALMKYPTFGWHVYLLSGSRGHYVGISSQPQERLKAHSRRFTVGKLYSMKSFFVGPIWRAYEIEHQLHRLPIKDARSWFTSEEEFRKKQFDAIPVLMHELPAAIRWHYLKNLNQS